MPRHVRGALRGQGGSCALSFVLSLAAAGSAVAQTIAPVTDINPGSSSADPSYLTPLGELLYFRANDAPHGTNTELWRYDGLEAALAAEIRPGTDGSLPSHLTAHEGMLYFAASGPTGGTRLWRFDGETASLAPDPLGWKPSNPEELISFGGVLYFRAFASNIGIELFKFDGDRIEPLDLFPGQGSSYPQHFIEFLGGLYFNAGATPGEGTELYRLDLGSRATKVTSIWAGGASPESFAVHDGALWFSAYEPGHGRELWRYDGAGAVLMADIVPGPTSSNPYELTSYRGALYFGADDGVHGAELWRFDGTTAEMVADVNPTPFVPDIDPVHHSWPGNLHVHDDILWFAADDGVHGRELWMYDGTEPRLVSDIRPGPDGSNPGEIVSYRDQLFLTADDGVTGGELGGMVVLRLVRSAPAAFRRGDANGDAALDVSDAVTVLLHLFGGGAMPECEKSEDVDDDGSLTISDPIRLLATLFRGAPPPPAPWEACGDDPTPDRLTCEAFAACP